MALIQYMARIQFEFGARHILPSELALAGITRPLIVSDAGIAASGLLDRALEALPASMSGAPRHLSVPSNLIWMCRSRDRALSRGRVRRYRRSGWRIADRRRQGDRAARDSTRRRSRSTAWSAVAASARSRQ